MYETGALDELVWIQFTTDCYERFHSGRKECFLFYIYRIYRTVWKKYRSGLHGTALNAFYAPVSCAWNGKEAILVLNTFKNLSVLVDFNFLSLMGKLMGFGVS